jgi:7-carboxy-7-deazaguanine synthase
MPVYSVKEKFFTLQGEGKQAGRPAVFCRFSGCNLWTGREQDRSKAVCTFCDTDFVGTNGQNGGKYSSPDALADAIDELWPTHRKETKYVVCTGGEPLLQVDSPLIDALHARGFEIAVETNGTIQAPAGIDWICVSPKADAALVQTSGSELKLVYPQELAKPEQFATLDFDNFLLQALDNEDYFAHMQATVSYCRSHPQWQLSLQTHKYLGID